MSQRIQSEVDLTRQQEVDAMQLAEHNLWLNLWQNLFQRRYPRMRHEWIQVQSTIDQLQQLIVSARKNLLKIESQLSVA